MLNENRDRARSVTREHRVAGRSLCHRSHETYAPRAERAQLIRDWRPIQPCNPALWCRQRAADHHGIAIQNWLAGPRTYSNRGPVKI